MTVDSSTEVMGSSTAPSSQSTKPSPHCERAAHNHEILSDTQRVTTGRRPCSLIRFLPSAGRKGAIGVELMLVSLQLSSDGALVVAILIIGFILWALWP